MQIMHDIIYYFMTFSPARVIQVYSEALEWVCVLNVFTL